ncbi:MAG: molybdenum cofactor guanylyltransferase MobA [Pseudomonadota bacterium]
MLRNRNDTVPDITPARKIPKTAALVLAGGEGKRMGGDKPFRELAGKPLIAHVIAMARQQCDIVMISSNENPARFAAFDCMVIADYPMVGQGPLGGLLGGLRALPDDIDWLATFPVDCPVLPDDLVQKLATAAQGAGRLAAFAQYDDRDHFLAAVWHRDGAETIETRLANDDRRVGGALRAVEAVRVTIPIRSGQPVLFANINTPDDLAILK